MTRYFYRDPLAAAWMTKHFGMKIDLGKGTHGLAAKAIVDDGVLQVCLGFNADLYCYYIHSDSLHLLEPQVGDLLTSGEVIRNSIAVATLSDLERCGVGIILRVGNVFIWPEVDHG